MTPFIRGLELCAAFHHDCVAPLLAKRYPNLKYSAARLGGGSDVLGFDTPQSRDHDWGPQVDVFLSADDYKRIGDELYKSLAMELPFEFKGYSTNFENDYLMGATRIRPIVHRVKTHSVESYFQEYIGLNPIGGLAETDWLRVPTQLLRTIRSGSIYHDGLGVLGSIKQSLHWYPDNLWYYLLACQWRRIDQEEPFAARCGDVGDELGSRLVASRQANEIMNLCFLMEKEFAPYYKWFGTAFGLLPCAEKLRPMLEEVFMQTRWQDREGVLNTIYVVLGEMHNELSVTEPILPDISPFHTRPYLVPHSAKYVDALMARVQSPLLKSLERPIGSIDQFVNSTDILCWNGALQDLSGVYRNR